MKACGILLGIWALAVLMAGCAGSRPEYDVVLSDLEPATVEVTPPRPEAHVLRMAVAIVNSPRSTLPHYQRLVEYLARRMGREGELTQGKTYAEINDLVREGNVALAMVCTNPYVEGQEDFGMEALVVPEVNGQAVYYAYLIVPKNSRAQTLEDLRGKVFAFTDPLSNSGRLVIVDQLLQQGETSESFFSRYIFTYSHEHAIQAVADELVDGASVDSLIYDYLAARQPQAVANTRIITRYGPYGSNPIVVPPQLDPDLKQQIRDLLLHMHEDAEGRSILQALGVDRFVLPDDASYEPVRAMRRRLLQAGIEPSP